MCRATDYDVVTSALKKLRPETFGERLARARNSSPVGLRSAAELISHEIMPVSFATLSRLEDFPEPPPDPRKRMLATLAVLAYGFDPSDFELSVDDLPRAIDVDAFVNQADALRSRLAGSGSSPRRSVYIYETAGEGPCPVHDGDAGEAAA